MSLDTNPRDVVLYVEDHPVNVQLMKAVFALRPELELLIARNAAEAMDMAPSIQPALVLLDLRLPDCHGTELLERLRTLPGWEHVTAIAVTAEAEFVPAGTSFADVWHKPLRLATLLTRLDRVLVPRPPLTDDLPALPTRSLPPLADRAGMAGY